jgi:hypothetical protein
MQVDICANAGLKLNGETQKYGTHYHSQGEFLCIIIDQVPVLIPVTHPPWFTLVNADITEGQKGKWDVHQERDEQSQPEP